MKDMIKILENQLKIEEENVKNQLTNSNLDVIFKLTTTICNLKKMCGDWEASGTVAEVAEDVIKKYSNGRYDHNIDALYDGYIAAKQAYQTNGDQQHKDKLMEALGRLMVEIYDMLSAMMVDSDFRDEKEEIMRRIKMLSD
uniref:Uncharacterized protein n=1 Tax=Siphoviridae sp. ctGfF74 TaxID=2826223 RepID=A0A8S5NJU9_9CAUD|nr:MAG TPA: hypothetical protein [Siphoviridae sp. ctGfF74]DAG26906.1 MAG TPA: hypothetical protein [Bacteriophage sp.]DAG85404.1 MAG TPA: hypothetical protein [Caudoviricetes sp.]DAN01951.1 MAG TPA: hypothetical protein [Caudoviricetes sp.]